MKAIYWPWIITGLTLGGLALSRSAEAAPPPPAPPPGPTPPGPLPPGPLPPAPEPGCNAPPELIAQAGVLAAQAANPLTRNTLDPDVMDTLSDRLDQHGCETEASTLRAAANLVRLSRGNRPFQPAPGGGNPAAGGASAADLRALADAGRPDLAPQVRMLLDPAYKPASKTSALHAIDALVTQLRKIGTTEATHLIAELQERKQAFKFPG